MSVSVTRQDGVLVVRLANPDRRNVIDMPLAVTLGDAFADLDGIGAIALLADGDHFCVGGDVRGMATAPEPGSFVSMLADEFHRTIRAIQTSPPVVVGVRGWAAGGGMSLVLACDVIVAGESASFQPAYPGIGVTPDGGMSWTLPRIVGEHRARSLLLQNRPILADEAAALGIADRVMPDHEVETSVLALARQWADGPRAALAGVKKLIADGAARGLDEHLDAESASIGANAAGPDGREGIAAFTQRRKAVFGR